MTTHICSPEVTSWLDFFFWYLKWQMRKILIQFDIEWWKFNIIFQKQSHSFRFEVTTHPNFFYNVTVAGKINSYCTDVKMNSVNVMQCPCISFNICTLTFILLTLRIWWAPNNANRWQMGYNSAFKGLICTYLGVNSCIS